MSYTPTNWKAGDIVTSAKLNKMEQGIAAGGGIRIVHLTINEGQSEGGSIPARSSTSAATSIQLDITPNELMDAFDNDEIIVIINYVSRGWSLISNFLYDGTTYTIQGNDNLPPLTSSDPDEYFTYDPNSESSGDDDSDDSGGIK